MVGSDNNKIKNKINPVALQPYRALADRAVARYPNGGL